MLLYTFSKLPILNGDGPEDEDFVDGDGNMGRSIGAGEDAAEDEEDEEDR